MEQILYKSTRGKVTGVKASEAILKGIAEDGGLFVPETMPKIEGTIEALVNLNYKELAYNIMSKFFTDFTEDELKKCIESAYDEKFDTKEIAPVKEVGNEYVLELYHGPTIAFKDMALSILPYLMMTSAKKQKVDKEIVILTATSGDTGKAALEGFANVKGTKIIVFYPEDGVSEVQKKQMTTQEGDNTYVLGIKGNFDDAQTGVKEIFTNKEFGEVLASKGYVFSSANSINIGRLVPQVVYYFHAYLTLCKNNKIKVGDAINFVVPTGNFGNILAGYYAKSMGLPVNKLICASNDNKVLYDFIKTGIYDKERDFHTTISPSMDIIISSNLERLLYFIAEGKSEEVAELMEKLSKEGSYKISDAMKENLKGFYGNYASEAETGSAIKKVFSSEEYLMDTHTAVAYAVYEKYLAEAKDNTKAVIVSTASPYKFTAAVMKAIDAEYERFNDFELMKKMNELTGIQIPKAVDGIETRKVIHTDICEKHELKKKVEDILGI